MITAYNQYQVPVGFADKILFAQKSVTLSYYNYVKELMGKHENLQFGGKMNGISFNSEGV